MISDIEKKIRELSPEGQDAVLAFVEFLLSRQDKQDTVFKRSDEEGQGTLEMPGIRIQTDLNTVAQDRTHPHNQAETTESGIILAEERIIEENNHIDFADINTRFSSQENGKETEKVRRQKMFDWL